MSPTRMSRFEASIQVVLEFHEAFNRHDVAGMMQLMSDDCVIENSEPAPNGATYKGRENITRFWQDFFQKSPQAKIEIEDIFSAGMRCIMRWKYDWKSVSGNKGYVRGIDLFQVKDGLIVEKLSYVKG